MLRELHLSGLGIIEDVELELDPGLNVLTGETGAGKTMVTVGLALALGRRASATLVRAGADAARVQARFDAVPAEAAVPWAGPDGELVLARTIAADGRSTARIGAELAPVSALAAVAGSLVEIHGQHEGIGLLSPAAQLAFVDRSAGEEHLARVDALHEAHARLRAARERLDALRASEHDRARELDLLAYQVGEIERAAPRPGELADLETEQARLAHAERLLERSTAAERSLDVDEGAGADLAAVAAELAAVADLDREAAVLADTARSIAATVIELARDVRAYRESLDLDPGRLAEVDERLATVRGLLRRYGDDEKEVLRFLDEARARIELLTRSEESRAAAEVDVAAAQTLAVELAAEVRAGRDAAAPRLAAAVQAELRDLGMPDAGVEVELAVRADSETGAQRAEMLLSARPGQRRMPLARVASGGELSRTMLACRTVLADLDSVPTIVFDEVDAGIGGIAGVAVGRRLAALARTRQVLVVTHLPQIAAFADRHLRVEKHAGTAVVTAVDDAGRVLELTRMLSGMPGSDAAASHAEELLTEAGRVKAETAEMVTPTTGSAKARRASRAAAARG